MGLLMSDSLLPDRLLDEARQLLDGLSELACAPEVAYDVHEREADDPGEWPWPACRCAALAIDADPWPERSA